jgi:hypothetical protein
MLTQLALAVPRLDSVNIEAGTAPSADGFSESNFDLLRAPRPRAAALCKPVSAGLLDPTRGERSEFDPGPHRKGRSQQPPVA